MRDQALFLRGSCFSLHSSLRTCVAFALLSRPHLSLCLQQLLMRLFKITERILREVDEGLLSGASTWRCCSFSGPACSAIWSWPTAWASGQPCWASVRKPCARAGAVLLNLLCGNPCVYLCKQLELTRVPTQHISTQNGYAGLCRAGFCLHGTFPICM